MNHMSQQDKLLNLLILKILVIIVIIDLIYKGFLHWNYQAKQDKDKKCLWNNNMTQKILVLFWINLNKNRDNLSVIIMIQAA